MLDPTAYKVHDVNVTTAPRLGKGGTVTRETTVTYMIGTHGPFSLVYPEGTYDATTVKLDIQKEIDQLQAIDSWAG